MSITVESIHAALAKVVDPELGRSLTDVGVVADVAVEAGDAARVSLMLPIPGKGYRARIEAAVTEAARAAGAKSVSFTAEMAIPTRNILSDDPCPGVKNIVLVMSGKGGVGKSTVATNLTLATARLGARVGLLDADMYGPSIPTMLGVSGRPTSADGQKFMPLERFGVALMSIGFLLEDARSAVVWRGPMLQNALLQFLRDVEWGELDYLFLDLPPGTGDITLTISQKLRTTGAIIVTTPQEVALQDVYKSVSMAQKVGIPLLGVVENESYFICDGCEKKHHLFGSGGGQKIAEFADAPLLGQIPIDPAIREWGDAGTPIVQAAPESGVGQAFSAVAERLLGRVSAHDLGRSGSLKIDRSGGTQRHLPIFR
ncbi:Scaffold protein for [4Fe-4S] cluster assembly ApbC, MRP-like protein [Minicystis rosea]|nr:Scaffold protein for [4Fe-4S] cluster assembly ApbC, MRP-like protein [Minicystis rosea]